jgi:glycosidase
MRQALISTATVVFLFHAHCAFAETGSKPVEAKQHGNDELLLHVPSPDWRDQIIYFLMTDRFNDGDKANNNQGFGEYNVNLESHYSGGDIQGVIDKLDYIQGLGITSVWTTPVVANQWLSTPLDYTGYHGYWAVDFNSIDKHKGDISLYQSLSDQLHRRGMYLIKDIVVNHTGNFFNYQGGHSGYNPKNTAENFFLFEDKNAHQARPTQAPFNLIDRNNPDHAEADIYHWTPSITDFRNTEHQYNYQLATLADIKTSNPIVVEKFKEIYGDWIQHSGVDAFRIDTVKYVEPDFFDKFMNDENGILNTAKSTGRDHFLAFGEVFETSKPYENDAEKRVASYLGSKNAPLLNSVISFPLHLTLKTVFAQGAPTDHLAYRVQQHMEMYRDPYVIPTFIDNHDMERFLAGGYTDGFKQALATILTIPGIPTIYQGSEQAMTESRQAMFKGGFNAKKDYFDTQSELYQFIRQLAALRTSNKVFTRGSIEFVGSNKTGPGIFAFTRTLKDKKVLVMMNTASYPVLASRIKVNDGFANLSSLYGEFDHTSKDSTSLDEDGTLTAELKARSIVILDIQQASAQPQTEQKAILTIQSDIPNDPITTDIIIKGRASFTERPVFIVENTRVDTTKTVKVDAQGNWELNYPVENLGEDSVSLVAYDPVTQATSEKISFTTMRNKPSTRFTVDDSSNNNGIDSTYTPPQHDQSMGQQDIRKAKVEIGGDVMKLTLTMRELTDDWIPANGFDNVAFSVFFDTGEQTIQDLPLLNTQMPDNKSWRTAHIVYGWGNTTFTYEDASATKQGKRLGVAPNITVNKLEKTITFTYRGSQLNINDWRGVNIYISTWDITGEGMYRELSKQPSDWTFSGGEHTDPKVFDSMFVSIP